MMTDLQFARLIIELDKHPHKEEIIELMHEQIDDMNSVKYLRGCHTIWNDQQIALEREQIRQGLNHLTFKHTHLEEKELCKFFSLRGGFY